jgi:N-glycosylase/DNA lyase
MSVIRPQGVGPKVADCVALFSLDCPDVVPVDTHIAQIAASYFNVPIPHGGSMTKKLYKRVGEAFRAKFGERGGWAHCVLFAAELPAFKTILSHLSKKP